MRTTHFELLKASLGSNFKYLEGYFDAITAIDVDPTKTVEETIFDRVIPPTVCAQLFRTPNTDRSTRIQRKMDLAVLRQAYHLWRDSKYFDISHKLTSKLIDTELRDVDTFFIKSPYRAIYMNLPKGNGLFIPNKLSGLHEVEAIYLTFDDFGDPQDIATPSDNKKLIGATKKIHMLVCGETKELSGDALMFYDLVFFEGKVSESIEKNKDILENPELWPSITTIFDFVSKVLLYINCSNVTIQRIAGLDVEAKLDGLKSIAKKRKLIKKYGKISPQAHNYLDVIINHGHDSSGQRDGHTGSVGPMALEKVRPHFKTQRYGTARSQAKIIWVESYIRGEGAEFYREKHSFKVT